jgi:hypothetical protein
MMLIMLAMLRMRVPMLTMLPAMMVIMVPRLITEKDKDADNGTDDADNDYD